MRLIFISVIIVAVMVAGGTAYLLRNYLNDQSAAKAKEEQKQVMAAYVLVANKNISVGTQISSGNASRYLTWRAWPADAVDASYRMEKTDDVDFSNDFAGATVTHPVRQGEPITEAKLFRGKTGGFLAGSLGPGMRAVSIAVNATSAAQGFIFPGDQVDVVLIHDKVRDELDRRNSTGTTPAKVLKYTSEVILRNVRVLAIDQHTSREERANAEDKAKIPGSVALEVTAKGAEVLETARMMGTISLILRSLADNQDETKPQATASRNGLTYTTDMEVSPLLSDLDRIMSGKKKHRGPVVRTISAPKPSIKVYRGSNPVSGEGQGATPSPVPGGQSLSSYGRQTSANAFRPTSLSAPAYNNNYIGRSPEIE